MPKIPRYLIISADEQTWKFDRPVIFLSDWCRLYERRHIWKNMDAIIAAPYGLELANKDADNAQARILEDELFLLLCNVLNRYHGVDHGARFWKIIFGHWLKRYVDAMLNRVKTLEQCLANYIISGVSLYANNHYILAVQDSFSFILASNDKHWNNALNARILSLLQHNIPLELISDCEPPNFCFNSLETPKKFFLKWIYKHLGKITSCMSRDSDAFIISSYLPKIKQIQLQLALGQCPQFWLSSRLEILIAPDHQLRKKLANQVIKKTSNNLEYILITMLFELLPVCFLEGFSNLNNIARQERWPKNPKFIFTSNNFDTDEVFKLWVATKVESGSKYFIGQHGNHYGTHRHFNPTIEEVIADKFLTWGWTDGLPQHTPAFVFKIAGNKVVNFNLNRGLLLLEDMSCQHQINTWDNSSQHLRYISDQIAFIEKLSAEPLKNLTIRLHSSYIYTNPLEESFWNELKPGIKIDTSRRKLAHLISESRLIIYSYDSSGILENLAKNIPTLAFWQNDFDHLRDNAKPYYQLLINAGILHLTPESIAKKVNEIWSNVDAWWMQNKVQKARKEFCDRYARVSNKPIHDLKKILLSN